MTNKKIEQEHICLLHSRKEETIRCNYIQDQEIRILSEANERLREIQSLGKMEIPASPEERDKHYLHIRELRIQTEVANEVFKMLDRMKDKSKRKLNEINKKIDQFLKRHGIEKIPSAENTSYIGNNSRTS